LLRVALLTALVPRLAASAAISSLSSPPLPSVSVLSNKRFTIGRSNLTGIAVLHTVTLTVTPTVILTQSSDWRGAKQGDHSHVEVAT
jgi:hypothetical protein